MHSIDVRESLSPKRHTRTRAVGRNYFVSQLQIRISGKWLAGSNRGGGGEVFQCFVFGIGHRSPYPVSLSRLGQAGFRRCTTRPQRLDFRLAEISRPTVVTQTTKRAGCRNRSEANGIV